MITVVKFLNKSRYTSWEEKDFQFWVEDLITGETHNCKVSKGSSHFRKLINYSARSESPVILRMSTTHGIIKSRVQILKEHAIQEEYPELFI